MSRAAMPESVFEELKRYVDWSAADEQALRALHAARRAAVRAHRRRRSTTRILAHEERAHGAGRRREPASASSRSRWSRWMDALLRGPVGRGVLRARAAASAACTSGSRLPQHYMFGAMNVLRPRARRASSYDALPRRPGAARARVAQRARQDPRPRAGHHARTPTARTCSRSRRASSGSSTFGQLVGSIGHELRNPLGVIETSLYILKRPRRRATSAPRSTSTASASSSASPTGSSPTCST